MTAGATAPGTGAACDSDLLTLVTAMLRYMLCGAPPRLRLHISQDSAGTWLHLTSPADPSHAADPAELTLIGSLATRWGSRGNQDERTLWALLQSPGSPAGGPATNAADG